MTYFLSDPIPAFLWPGLGQLLISTAQLGGKLARWIAIGMLQEEIEI